MAEGGIGNDGVNRAPDDLTKMNVSTPPERKMFTGADASTAAEGVNKPQIDQPEYTLPFDVIGAMRRYQEAGLNAFNPTELAGLSQSLREFDQVVTIDPKVLAEVRAKLKELDANAAKPNSGLTNPTEQ